GFTSVIGMFTSRGSIRNAIGYELAAHLSRGPASNHGGEFPGCASGHNDVQRFRRTKFLIAAFAVNHDLAVHASELCSFAVIIIFVMAHRNPSVLKQEFPDLLLAEAIAMQGLHMLRAQHHYRLKQHAHAVSPHSGERAADCFKDGFAAVRVVLSHSTGWLGGKQR